MAGDRRCPLLFLDVDGPLLPFGGSARPGSDEIAGVPHLARLRLNAGPRLAGLPCTLVWATTWLEDANTEIAPRLGLPDLPVVTWPEPDGATEREDQWLGLCWKTRTVVAWAAGRPFAWIDDEITEADRDWVSAHHRGPALLRRVDASIGLTDQDLTALDAWLRGLRLPAASAGAFTVSAFAAALSGGATLAGGTAGTPGVFDDSSLSCSLLSTAGNLTISGMGESLLGK